MNTLFLLKKDLVLSPNTDKKTLKKALMQNKFILLSQGGSYDYIDELTEQLDLIEDLLENRRRNIAIVSDLKEDHKTLLEKLYPQFDFLFIEFE